MFRPAALVFLCACATVPTRTPAAVLDVSGSGFMTRSEVLINAPPAAVYATLLHDVGKWWNPEHTYSGKSANLSIEARIGGCFCERLEHGGAVEHGHIINLQPGMLVRMTGAFGPLQSSGLAGTLSWALTAADGGTRVQMSYSVGGYMQGGFAAVAPPVDAVLGGQLERLKTFAETRKVP
jgi:uncharacterized protein YndB with AHSA1/START domain